MDQLHIFILASSCGRVLRMDTDKIEEKIKVFLDNVLPRIKWAVLISLLMASFTSAYLLTHNHFRYNIPINNSITATSTKIIPPSLNLPDRVFLFSNTYSWQTFLPMFVPLSFLNYSQLCYENNNQSYFEEGRLISEEEIEPKQRGDNGKILISFSYRDGTYTPFEVPHGETRCKKIDTRLLDQLLVNTTFLIRSDGKIVSEVRTDKSAMYVWPGRLNEVFLAGILFLVFSSALLYLGVLKKLILRD